MTKENPMEDSDYKFLFDLAVESARKGRNDRAEKIILHMIERWPERVIRRSGSVLAKDVKVSTNESSSL